MNQPQKQSPLKTWALMAGLCLSAGLSQAQTATGTIVRVSSFEYNADGMLSREVIEPESGQHCLQTTHSYSPQGNPSGTSTSACAGASGHTLSSAGTRSNSKEYLAQA